MVVVDRVTAPQRCSYSNPQIRSKRVFSDVINGKDLEMGFSLVMSADPMQSQESL